MLFELASHNSDIKRLLDKGYALRFDDPYLVILDVPYLDDQRALQIGAIVTKLDFVDRLQVKQEDHQIYFAGSVPYGLDGVPIPNLGGGPKAIPLSKTDVVVQRSFSNKPRNESGTLVPFENFFDKIEHYVRVISGPAISLHRANPLTFRVDANVVSASVFKFHDTLTSRAEIGDLVTVFKNETVAIIGLGGTGAYLLDYLVKTPVKEIRAFDGDVFQIHNAYRSPGKLDETELGQRKAAVYRARYEGFRDGLVFSEKYIDRTSADALEGVTFAFVCVDKGSARSEIFDVLISLRIPFIDVGMGLIRLQNALSGLVRTTYYSTDTAEAVRSLRLAEMADDPDDLYRTNVQISELNALNASFAVIRYKQLRNFYFDNNKLFHLLFGIENLRAFGLDAL